MTNNEQISKEIAKEETLEADELSLSKIRKGLSAGYAVVARVQSQYQIRGMTQAIKGRNRMTIKLPPQSGIISSQSHAFASATEIQNGIPLGYGTAKYHIYNVSPGADEVSSDFEYGNGPNTLITRTDFLVLNPMV